MGLESAGGKGAAGGVSVPFNWRRGRMERGGPIPWRKVEEREGDPATHGGLWGRGLAAGNGRA
jgi:hypothetical protein